MAITNATSLAGLVGASVTFAPSAGSITAQNIVGTSATFGANVTIGGTLTYDDVTNIDSVGLITARNGLQVLAGISTFSGQTNLTNTNVTAGILSATGQTNLANVNVSASSTAATASVTGQTALANVSVSAASTFTGAVDVNSTSDFGGTLTVSAGDVKVGSAVTLAASGANVTGILTATRLSLLNGTLTERVKITAGKLSANLNVNLSDGMVHYFTVAESTTAIPNIYSNVGINTQMATGDTIAVTLVTTANASGFSTGIEIDGVAHSPNWVGGSAPDSGGSSGVDIHAFTIIKTGSAAYTVIGNHGKTS